MKIFCLSRAVGRVATMTALLIASYPIFAQVELSSGAIHSLVPSDFECFERTFKEPEFDALIPEPHAECDNTSAVGTADVLVRTGTFVRGTVRQTNSRAIAGFDFNFEVTEVSGAAQPSFVPIHVTVPVDWTGRLLNNAILARNGGADLNLFLQLIDRTDNRSVELLNILNASHGGVGGCVTVPASPIALGTMAAKCALAVANVLEGSARIGLSAVVETGRTYSIALAARATVEKGVTATTGIVQISGSRPIDLQNLTTNTHVLSWEEMTVAIGSDPAQIQADIQEQLDALRLDLENHTHIFLTGRGVGHNNTKAETSSALLPAGEPLDDMDGVAYADDLCPGTPAGAAVDGNGCGLESFCALQERSRDCRDADWQDDESVKPKDCRWRSRSCKPF